MVRIGNRFKKIEYTGTYDESFEYHTPTGMYTTGGGWSASETKTWNDSYSILLKNNFAGGDMFINNYRETDIPAAGRTIYREATTFPHEVIAIDDQTPPDGYKRLWDKWSDGVDSLSRELRYAQSFDKMANFNKICNVTFQNSFVGGGNGGVISVNSIQYNSPTSQFEVKEKNPISSYAPNQTVNGIDYTFTQWSDGITSNPRTFYLLYIVHLLPIILAVQVLPTGINGLVLQ